MTIRAVVFDFDGVLANSEPLHFRGFQAVLAECGVALSESDYYSRYLGYDDAGAFAAIARDQGLQWSRADVADFVRRKALRLEELERETSVLFPGARAIVERLSEACPIAIASGALKGEILRVLDREELRHAFAAIVGAEDTPSSKPAPDPYLRAVRLLAESMNVPLDARECVAIEDSTWGLQSARAAGLRTVGITHTYPAAALDGADLVVDQLDSVTWEVLTRAFS